MVHRAQEAAIFDLCLTIVNPVLRVMRGADSRWSIAARETAAAVSGDEGAADAQWDGAHGAPDVERLGVAAQNDRNQSAIARQPAGVAGADQLPVVQSGGAQSGAQCVPVNDHGEMWGFACGGGEIIGGAGPVA